MILTSSGRDHPMPSRTPSLNALFAELHAHRVATMDPADLKVNVDQRQRLVATSDRSAFVKAGAGKRRPRSTRGPSVRGAPRAGNGIFHLTGLNAGSRDTLVG